MTTVLTSSGARRVNGRLSRKSYAARVLGFDVLTRDRWPRPDSDRVRRGEA